MTSIVRLVTEQRNDLEDSYWSDGSSPRGRQNENRPHRNHETPFRMNSAPTRILGGNNFITNCDNNDSKMMEKAPKKEKKRLKTSKRLKIFGSMKKPNNDKKKNVDEPLLSSFAKAEKEPDFAYLGRRRFLRDVNGDSGKEMTRSLSMNHCQISNQSSNVFPHNWLSKNESHNDPQNCEWSDGRNIYPSKSVEFGHQNGMYHLPSQAQVERGRSLENHISQLIHRSPSTHRSQSVHRSPSTHRSQSVHRSPSTHRSQSVHRSPSTHRSQSIHRSPSTHRSQSVHRSPSTHQSPLTHRSLLGPNNASTISGGELDNNPLHFKPPQIKDRSRSRSTHRSVAASSYAASRSARSRSNPLFMSQSNEDDYADSNRNAKITRNRGRSLSSKRLNTTKGSRYQPLQHPHVTNGSPSQSAQHSLLTGGMMSDQALDGFNNNSCYPNSCDRPLYDCNQCGTFNHQLDASSDRNSYDMRELENNFEQKDFQLGHQFESTNQIPKNETLRYTSFDQINSQDLHDIKTNSSSSDDTTTQVSALSMASPSTASQRKFLLKGFAPDNNNNNSSLLLGPQKPVLEEGAKKKGRIFCNFTNMQLQESDSGEDSSEVSEGLCESIVELSVDVTNMLPATSSLSSNSTNGSNSEEDEEGTKEERYDENTQISAVTTPDSEDNDTFFIAKRFFSVIQCKISDCLVPVNNSPRSYVQR
jgi:hypothetical protein